MATLLTMPPSAGRRSVLNARSAKSACGRSPRTTPASSSGSTVRRAERRGTAISGGGQTARSPHLYRHTCHWTVLLYAAAAERRRKIDDVLETGARDRGPCALLFCVRGGGAGGRGRRAEAFPVESHRAEGCGLSARYDPCRQGRFLSAARDHRGQF